MGGGRLLGPHSGCQSGEEQEGRGCGSPCGFEVGPLDNRAPALWVWV